MEWHESLRQLLSKREDEEENEGKSKASSPPQVADLLVVDNAKPHRRCLHESQSTVAETQVSPGSSINEEELSVLFEEFDLYGEDSDELHRSFPMTLTSRDRRRRRLRGNSNSSKSRTPGDDMALFARWGSSSDSMLDYNSLDDMLREENSQTASALINVFQPARRRSFEVSLSDVEDMSEATVDSDDGDRKPAAVPAPGHS